MSNKFNAVKCTYKDLVFDSIKEKNHYIVLRNMELSGEIKDLKLQPIFELVHKNTVFRAVKYIADFSFYDKDHNFVVQDVKGYKKGAAYQNFKLKQKMMYAKYQIEVIEI